MAELTGGGINLRRSDNSVFFWIARGWLDEPAEVRGEDTTVPGLEGQIVRDRKRHKRTIELRGQIRGTGASEQMAAAAHLALAVELEPIFFDLTAAPWALVAGDGYRGLAAGQTATINVRTVNVTPDARGLAYAKTYVIVLESIDSPPEWVIA